MPYYVGLKFDGAVESLNQTLSPKAAVARYEKFERVDAPVANYTHDDSGFRPMSEAEIEAARPKVARRFDKLALRDNLVTIDPALWETVKTAISADVSRAERWELTVYIAEDDTDFAAVLTGLASVAERYSVDVEALLAACVAGR